MINNFGFIKLWRKLQNNPLWEEHREYSKAEAWIDILMTARFEDKPDEVIIGMNIYTVNAGESIKSLSTWAKRWGWTTSKVRRFLKLLQKMNMIRHTSDTQTTRITVCNYCEYRDARNDNELQMKLKRKTNEKQMKTEREVPTNTVGTKKEERMFGEYVRLSDSEYQKLIDRFGKATTDDWIDRMNSYAASKPQKFREYKNHYATILNWDRMKKERDGNNSNTPRDPYAGVPRV
jgi:hypothetical protein